MADEDVKEIVENHKRGFRVPRVGDGTPGPGRPRGVPNKLTAEVKAMIEGALEEIGGHEWLASAATREPAAFMALLGKLIPKDVNLNGRLDISRMSDEELRAEVVRLLAAIGHESTPEPDLC